MRRLQLMVPLPSLRPLNFKVVKKWSNKVQHSHMLSMSMAYNVIWCRNHPKHFGKGAKKLDIFMVRLTVGCVCVCLLGILRRYLRWPQVPISDFGWACVPYVQIGCQFCVIGRRFENHVPISLVLRRSFCSESACWLRAGVLLLSNNKTCWVFAQRLC